MKVAKHEWDSNDLRIMEEGLRMLVTEIASQRNRWPWASASMSDVHARAARLLAEAQRSSSATMWEDGP